MVFMKAKELIERIRAVNNISFNPLQKKVLSRKLFEKNFVVSAPTASGKTLIAEIVSLNAVLNKNKKVLYTCPLRALASEHFREFKRKYEKEFSVRITISTGDFDSSSRHLQNYDIIFTTYEKAESLLRHRAGWLGEIGLLVIDEIHEIDSERGPTIEMVATKLSLLNPSIRILALSATIPNAKEISQWLKAELIKSSFRPVKLKEGIFFNSEIHFEKEKEFIEEKGNELESIVSDTLGKKKQALIFCNTRQKSVGFAKNLSSITEKFLSEKEKILLQKKSEEVLSVLESPTEQCRILSSLMKKGIAFHNAALMSKQRHLIEELFKSNHLKILCATPTLAAGINVPAFRVVIPSVYRFTAFGNQKIPVREYHQMAGRAGRPQYDSSGESILIARSEFELDELREQFVLGEIEESSSKLGLEPVLRTHVLASIASGFVFDFQSLEQFFGRTFYAFQFKELDELFLKINEILKELKEMNFIECTDKFFKATPLGVRVSELYLDPLTAFSFINYLDKNSLNDFGALFLFCSSYEFFPLISLPRSREQELWLQLNSSSSLLPIDLEREMFSDPSLLRKFNSALMLKDWLNEASEEHLRKNFNIQPGILYSKLLILDWLSYCLSELSLILNKKQHLPLVNKLRKRLKYGVREELLPLIELRGIGRVRARRLYNSNLHSISDIKRIDVKDLAGILGSSTALSVKGQLGQAKKFSKSKIKEVKAVERSGQTDLADY